MSSENASADWETPTTVTGDKVTLERKLSKNEDDVIATLEVNLNGEDPVEVEITDNVPDSWPVAEVGIHPQHMPRDFEADTNRFKFVDVVTSDEPLEVVYGVRLETPGSIPPPKPPVIEREELAPEKESESAEGFLRSDVDEQTEMAEAADSFRRGGSTGESAEKPPVWGQQAEDSEETGNHEAPTLESEDNGIGDSLGAEMQDGDHLGQDSLLDREGSLLGDLDANEDLVEAIAEEIESGEASEEALETIRNTLKVEGSQRDSVRLNHLQSRVEEFAAYAESLGDVIDEHGPLDEFLSDHAARIEAVEEEQEAISETVEEAVTDIETVENRLSAIDERVDAMDDVADDLEDVQDELDQLRRHHGDDIRDLESALNDLESSYDEAKGDLTAEMEDLRTEVERWDATRKRLAEALEPEGDLNDEFEYDSSDDD